MIFILYWLAYLALLLVTAYNIYIVIHGLVVLSHGDIFAQEIFDKVMDSLPYSLIATLAAIIVMAVISMRMVLK